ncbi:nitrate reductase molybdenum cofactor assembly chaperone [Microbulbifer hainanensis]|uniref:nitrate reductase molybdenum cofactor assembly chaperone n=1 Tax=Microbulbifer hainanensis TaxID=2735675 RepID=UPI0018677958|nr:nitrate reductase molybdenum cofactor assembly chaperone [Microbulbifer hainanensis]
MKILRLLSRLLDYPDESLYGNLAEIESFLRSQELEDRVREPLLRFVDHFKDYDLMDWQSEYDGLFERGRAVSLHLFEHIHGESRDRGQAMVDLMAQYQAAGLELAERELPDYLPTYLEFCATQVTQAHGWLADVSHVLALVAARLQKKDSPYADPFEALLALADVAVDMEALTIQVRGEERDDTPEAIDKVWEEEMVTFTAGQTGSACEQSITRPDPLQYRDDTALNLVDASDAFDNAACNSAVRTGSL